jgi:hypothetical protein
MLAIRRPFAPMLLALAVCRPAHAQVGLSSTSQTVTLTATKLASVSVSLPAGGSAVLPGSLSSGVNDFLPLPVATAWDVDPARTAAVTLVAYFDAPSRALAGPGAAIPSSRILGRVPTGGPKSFTPFTGSGLMIGGTLAGSAGGSLLLFTQSIGAENAHGGRTDDLQVRIDLTGAPELPAGTYAGTLNLVAITQ